MQSANTSLIAPSDLLRHGKRNAADESPDKKVAVLAQSIKQKIEAATQNTYYNKREDRTAHERTQSQTRAHKHQPSRDAITQSSTSAVDFRGHALLTERSEQIANKRKKNERLAVQDRPIEKVEREPRGSGLKGEVKGSKRPSNKKQPDEKEVSSFKGQDRKVKDDKKGTAQKKDSLVNNTESGEVHDLGISCENIDDLNLQQSAIQTPKKVSDMSGLKYSAK